MTVIGNTTVDPLAWATAVTKPAIDTVRNSSTSHVLDVHRLIRAFRYEHAILAAPETQGARQT